MMMTFQKMMPMSKPLVMEKVGVDLTLGPPEDEGGGDGLLIHGAVPTAHIHSGDAHVQDPPDDSSVMKEVVIS